MTKYAYIDRKRHLFNLMESRIDHWFSEIRYYPFGMVTPGRSFAAGSGYRFGFNGKESDPETYGSGNIYDYGFRIYNPRLGKFLSVDPLAREYSYFTPYQFASNKPTWAIDIDGLEGHELTGGNGYVHISSPNYWTGIVVSIAENAQDSYQFISYDMWQGSTWVNMATTLSYLNPQNYSTDAIMFRATAAYNVATTVQDIPDWDAGDWGMFTGDLLWGGLDFTLGSHGSMKAVKIATDVSSITKTVSKTASISKSIYKSVGTVTNKNLTGAWKAVKRGEKGMDYQSWLSGKKYNTSTGYIDEYHYNGIDFDGYTNGILYEAKDNYDWAVNKTTGNYQSWFEGKQSFIDEADAQITAASGTRLQWHFSQESSLRATYNLLLESGVDVTKIEFLYTPMTK